MTAGQGEPGVPEVVDQVAFEVIGNDVTITMAAQAGQLPLNASSPSWAGRSSTASKHLTNACTTLQHNCVEGIEADARAVRPSSPNRSPLVKALNPIIGYDSRADREDRASPPAAIADVAESLGTMTRGQAAGP